MKTGQGTKDYQIFEGREKQTLLDKYINYWTDRDPSVERSNTLIEDITISSSKKVSPSVAEEYKKFLLDFSNHHEEVSSKATSGEQDIISALSELIKSKKSSKSI